MSGKIRQSPRGLGLEAPYHVSEGIAAEQCLETREVRPNPLDIAHSARIDITRYRKSPSTDQYAIEEAIEAYKRASRNHGWEIPVDIAQIDSFGLRTRLSKGYIPF